MRCRPPFALWCLLPASVMDLPTFPQDTIQRGFRCHITALIQLVSENVRRWSAAVFGLVAQAHHRVTFLRAVFLARCWTICCRALIRRDVALSCPTLIRPNTQVQHVTGFSQPSAVVLRLCDQRDGVLAIREARHTSSSLWPQIASAFFDSVSNAAVSARALSLRRSSDSNFLMRFLSARLACWLRRTCLSIKSLPAAQAAFQRSTCSG